MIQQTKPNLRHLLIKDTPTLYKNLYGICRKLEELLNPLIIDLLKHIGQLITDSLCGFTIIGVMS